MWLPPWRMKSMLGAFPTGYPREYAEDIAAVAAWKDRGDPKPFKAVFTRYARGLYLYIFYNLRYNGKPEVWNEFTGHDGRRYKMPDSPEAVRLLNKTYYNALRGLKDFRFEASMGTWLREIAHNVVVDEARFASRNPALIRERRIAESKISTDAEISEAEKVQDAAETAEQAMTEGASGRRMLEAAKVVELAAKANLLDGETARVAAASLRFPDDIDAIAEVLGLPVDVARERVLRAQERLAVVSRTPAFIQFRKSLEGGQ